MTQSHITRLRSSSFYEFDPSPMSSHRVPIEIIDSRSPRALAFVILPLLSDVIGMSLKKNYSNLIDESHVRRLIYIARLSYLPAATN